LTRRLRIGTGPWLQAAYIEEVATHPECRRRGYGSAVMQRLQQEIGHFNLGALSPAREDWYERLGWERRQGPLFILKDEELQHRPDECVLVYRTLRTPELDLKASLTAEWRPFELW
jgi:aminoglycoside 2'-N-acetyltransferase I